MGREGLVEVGEGYLYLLCEWREMWEIGEWTLWLKAVVKIEF